MIYVEKDSSNTIVLTLNEKALLASPYYLFVFENEYDTTVAPIELYLENTSTATDRYDLFTLIEGDGTGADVELTKGQYTYTIYEAASQPATVTDTTGDIVEFGRMVVSSETVVFNTIYD